MRRRPLLMVGFWSAGTAAATALAWVGAHAVSSAIGATAVPAVPPDRQALTFSVVRSPAHPAGASPVKKVLVRTGVFSDPGGTVTVSCATSGAKLLSASPADGYRGVVQSAGPSRISVSFAGRERDYLIRAQCTGDRPVGTSTVSEVSRPPARQ